ncbi:hypothetical protein [Planktotalea arctica]|uniref:hypothetical protein n=1 Tax=Planktotalea arctica TaxID=1481893 RepID=UPI00111BF469|nr:hypothetical protein [Planktotalea arctica]
MAATTYVCDTFEEDIVDGRLNYPESTFAESVFGGSAQLDLQTGYNLNRLHPDYEISKVEYYELKLPVAQYLVALAHSDGDFYDFCCKIAAANLRAKRSIPEPLVAFASLVLEGLVSKPKKRSRPRKKDWSEKYSLWNVTLQVVEKFDLELTRNDETAGHISACDAVAEALTLCGRPTTYGQIKNLMVHPDHSRLRKEFIVSTKIKSRWRDVNPPQNALSPNYFDYWFNAAKTDVMDILGTFPSQSKKSD